MNMPRIQWNGVVLDHKGLKDFSAILRDQSRWPEGFTWHFPDSNHCGLGLAGVIYGSSSALKNLGGKQICHIFYAWEDTEYQYLGNRDEVTPEMVADRLDEYLDNHCIS